MEEYIEDRSSSNRSEEERNNETKSESRDTQEDIGFKKEGDKMNQIRDSEEEEFQRTLLSSHEETSNADKPMHPEDEEEYNESMEEKRSAGSSEKEDFFYLDEKTEQDERDSDIPLPEYSDYEKIKGHEISSVDDITESKETQIYYSKEDSELSEGEDIIECRETMFPTRKDKKKKRESDEPPRKTVKLNEEEINNLHQIRWQEFSEYMSQQEKKIEMRERGWKPNSKPLLWKYEIEQYEDTSGPIGEDAVIERFRKNIEKTNKESPQKFIAPGPCPYSKKIAGKKGKNIREIDLKRIKEKVETNRILQIQEKLREEAKDEQRMLNSARNLHVELKEKGHQTESSEIFTLLSQRYIFQKKSIVNLIQEALDDLSFIHNIMQENNQYFFKCLDFIEQKIKID